MPAPRVTFVARQAVALAVAISWIAGCSSSSRRDPFAIDVSPDSVTIAEGRSASFSAWSNRPLDRLTPFSWQIVGPFVAGVDAHWDLDAGATAYVIGFYPGRCEVHVLQYAYSADAFASARVTVLGVSAKTLAISPQTATVDSGGYVLLIPEVRDSVGVSLLRSGFEWSCSDSSVAFPTWLPSGGFSGIGVCRVECLRPGEATLTARVEGLAAEARITVRPLAPGSSSLTAPASSAAGTPARSRARRAPRSSP